MSEPKQIRPMDMRKLRNIFMYLSYSYPVAVFPVEQKQ